MAETAVHGCLCLGDMAVRIRNVLARPWVGVRVCHLVLLFVTQIWSINHVIYFWSRQKAETVVIPENEEV